MRDHRIPQFSIAAWKEASGPRLATIVVMSDLGVAAPGAVATRPTLK